MDLGQRVGGRYQLEERLASEVRLTVYRALDEQTGEPVILHVHRDQPAWRGSPWLDLRLRLPELIERSADLCHPHLLCPRDWLALDDGDVAVTYPLLEGQPLDQRVGAGPLSPEQALRMASDLCGALQALHARGLVHRDIKPRNILLADHGALLTGLEWAQLPSDLVAGGPREQHPGSPAYTSPEQATAGGRLDGRSDLYSLGLVLREALAGRPARDIAPAAGDLGKGANGSLGVVLWRALQADPSRRYQSADELGHDLDLLARGSIGDRLRLHLRRMPGWGWALGSIGAVALVWLLLLAGSPDNRASGRVTSKMAASSVPVAWLVETAPAPESPASMAMEAAAVPQPVSAEARAIEARPVELRVGQFVERAFTSEGEVHRAAVRVAGGRGYLVATANLAPGVDTILDVSHNGQRSSNDDAWPGTLASSVFVLPAEDSTLSLQVSNRGVVGEDATYELLIVEADPTPTPTAEPTEVVAREEAVTMTPRPTYTPQRAATATRAPTRTPRPTSTRRPTYTPRPTMSATPSVTPSPAPTARPTATATPPRTVLPIKTVTTPVW